MSKAGLGGGQAWCQQFFTKTFLPEGYPNSVTPDYLSFQLWDTLQALCSYIRGMMASHAILTGSGMMTPGSSAATSAIYMFFLRDLTGMLGGILFAKMQGSSFDSDAKSWRLFADVANDVGMAVEMASPMFPGVFMAMACFGSLARAVTGVAGGATRAALTHHFAACGNAADVAAKEQSQETATTMVGMVLGMLLIRLFPVPHTAAGSYATKVVGDLASPQTQDARTATGVALWGWYLFALLTLLHVVANIRAMQSLVLPTLNASRLTLLLRSFVKGQGRRRRQLEARVQSAHEDYIIVPSTTAVERASAAGGFGTTTDAEGVELVGLPTPAEVAGEEDLCPPPHPPAAESHLW
ncbi:MAG: hypothetical protein WDW36_008550 [Sanguina aurantia]